MRSVQQTNTVGLAENDTERGAIRDVLVIDDSQAQLDYFASILTGWGFSVTGVTSGEAALDLLSQKPFDLVMSDWMMPGMSGLEVCERCRAMDSDQQLYFILLSWRSTGDDVACGLAAGADDFLCKSVEATELKARIAAGDRHIATQRALMEKNHLLENTLRQLQHLYDGIARDLVEARRLQQSLVPERFRNFPEGDVSLLLRPSGHVGGDLVGAVDGGNGQLGLFAIDVSGHGIASALLTARLAGYFSGKTPEHNIALVPLADGGHEIRPPADICHGLNALTIGNMETELYFTMMFARCDLATGAVEIAQAGHPHPMIQRATGKIEFPGEGGMPIGLMEEPVFGSIAFRLEPGDRLMIYSDGFTEQVGPDGEMLDELGLARIARKQADTVGGDFLEGLIWHLADHAGDADFDDDLSAVVFEYRGPG